MAYQHPANGSPNTRLSPSNTMIYLLIAVNCAAPIFRAVSSGNNSILAFILFIYASFFFLEYCYYLYQRFPENENCLQKKLLAVAIWCLFSGIMFGFAYQFGAHFPFAFAVTIYVVAFAASAIIFYVYLIYNCQPCTDNCCTGEKVTFSQESVNVIFEKV